MDKIHKSKVFYLFIDQVKSSSMKIKQTFLKYETFVEQTISFSKQYPISNLVQIIRNKEYGLKEMIRDKRNFNYESYFFNGWCYTLCN
jgi:hypothetical protein